MDHYIHKNKVPVTVTHSKEDHLSHHSYHHAYTILDPHHTSHNVHEIVDEHDD